MAVDRRAEVHFGYYVEETKVRPYWEKNGITRATVLTPDVIRQISFITPAIKIEQVLSEDGYSWVVMGKDRTGVDGWGAGLCEISRMLERKREKGTAISSLDGFPGGLIAMRATVGEIEDLLIEGNAHFIEESKKYNFGYTRVAVLGPAIHVDRQTGAVHTNTEDMMKWELPIKSK